MFRFLKFVKRTIFRYPLQAGLDIYIIGIYTYIKNLGISVVAALPGQTNDYITMLSESKPIAIVTQFLHIDNLQSFFTQSPYFWLLSALFISSILRTFRFFVQIVISLLIIVAGVYLAYIYFQAHNLL